MKEYKGHNYFLDKDGLWKVILDRDRLVIVALDDSKLFSNRKIIDNKNNEKTCKEYIDLITKE